MLLQWTLSTFLSLLFVLIQLTINAQEYVKDQLLVQVKNGIKLNVKDLQQSNEYPAFFLLNQKYGLNAIREIGNIDRTRTYVLKFKEEIDVYKALDEYRSIGLFDQLEPNFIAVSGQGGSNPIIPNDTYFSNQWQHGNIHPSGLDLKTRLAWNKSQGDSSVVIAIIDTGVKLDHPEFAGRIWRNPNESIDNVDNDTNGFVDDYRGWDFVNQDNNPTDDEGHGTAMTGHIGANANNNFFYAGVDWNSKLMILKAGDRYNFFAYSDIIAAIYYATDMGADIINMSFGGFSYSTFMHQSISYADSIGVITVACAGNNNLNVVWYPAAYPETIAVGAMDKSGVRAAPFYGTTGTGSNYGPELDLMAPGNIILGLDHLSNNYLFKLSGGTSAATALVSGICGLLKARDSSLSPQQVKQILTQTALDQVGPPNEDSLGYDIYFGHGLVDANGALNQLIVGAAEFSKEEKAILFPNPAQDALSLQFSGGGSRLEIKDLKGRVVILKTLERSKKELKIDIQALKSGIYILSVFDQKGNIMFAQKFIRQE